MMLQFPKEVSGPVTIWPRYTDLLTGNQINIRRALRGCFWNSDSISIFKQTGAQVAYNVTIFIPYRQDITGYTYIAPEEWYTLGVSGLDKYWTIDPRQLPIVAQGENDHEFQWAAPTATNRIAVQETAFLTANPTAKRAVDVNPQLFGSLDMWHIKIRA